MNEFFREFFANITPPEYFLLSLAIVMAMCGFLYKLKVKMEISRTRARYSGDDRAIKASKQSEKEARDALQTLLNTQNMNASRIAKLQRDKAALSNMPNSLSAEIEELDAWCRQRNIVVDFDRRQASRKPTPRGRRI